MKEISPKEFSKKKIDQAGTILSRKQGTIEERDKALEILSSWRAAHNYPLQVFFNRLKRVSESIDTNPLISQRLKRVPSILNKLNRKYEGLDKPSMRLTQVQDIAGCRAVLSNINLVQKLYEEEYLKGDLKHKRIKVNDYISNPKKDGYRSIHLIYKFFSDKGKAEFNDLLIEVQIRSKLQHIWATAVETVGFFTKQAIKSNEGEKEWLDFFKLVASAFAIMENSTLVEGTPRNKKELHELIKKKEKELDVTNKMHKWTESIRNLENNFKNKQNFHYVLLELDTNLGKLTIKGYSRRQEDKAIQDYLDVEKRIFNLPSYDVVLVGTDTLQDLKKAYPNYFLDTKEFLKYLDKILNQ